jgi:hypothetical protein
MFKEVLLSYQIIFGQTKSSYQAARKHAKIPDIILSEEPVDPLVQTLCYHGWKSKESIALYDEIGEDEPSHIYSANDFPILGKKLTQLQTFVKCHNPSNLKDLWHDRRNMSQWYTFWVSL